MSNKNKILEKIMSCLKDDNKKLFDITKFINNYENFIEWINTGKNSKSNVVLYFDTEKIDDFIKMILYSQNITSSYYFIYRDNFLTVPFTLECNDNYGIKFNLRALFNNTSTCCICMEDVLTKSTGCSKCGTQVCMNCIGRIDKCPTCRKIYSFY